MRRVCLEAIKAGDVGPLSKAACEWLGRNHDTPETVSRAEPEGKKWATPDLVTREEIHARVAYLVRLREAALEAAAAWKAAGKAKRGAKMVG
jgi:acyl-CoA reductase-like NAD-dependent aldehyde dehydrogenase